MSRQWLSLAIPLLVLIPARPIAQPGSVPGDPIVITAKLDAEGYDQMLVPIRVNDHTFWCDLDSGGSWVLSMDTAEALAAGLRPNATGSSAGAGPEVRRDERVRGVTVRLGDVTLQDTTIVLGPRPASAPDIDCVLGLALLPDYAVEFDYVTPRVRLHAAKTFRPSPRAVAVPFNLDRFRNPNLEAAMTLQQGDQIRANLILDTGAASYSSILVDRFIKAHNVTARVGAVAPQPMHTPGIQMSVTRLTGLKVGAFEIADSVAGLLMTPSPGIIHDGVVGAGFFRRFTVTFDYTRQQMWLEPNERLKDRQVFDASGIEFKHAASAYVVHAIVPSSPAAEAGIREGDLLVRIDDRDARQLTLAEVKALLSRPGLSRTVRFQRGGTELAVTLLLKERI